MILAERYQIIQPLAQGGFGKTFLACDRHLPTHPQCVIKQLFLAQASANTLKTAQRLFDLEAKTLYRLGTHKQIPTLLAHFEHDGDFYLVQDYIPGDSLYDAFAQRPVFQGASPETLGERIEYTQALLQNLLRVLAFVHQQNVIHRDIKPANIIRRHSDNQLVLIDFGAVKALNTATTQAISSPLTVAIGSPGYMPPEQQAGRPCFASDLYALGMVALEALTDNPPRRLTINPRTGRFDLVETPDNRELLDFLRQLTRLDPGDRFADAAAALRSLEVLANRSDYQSAVPSVASSASFPATAFPATAFPATAFPATAFPRLPLAAAHPSPDQARQLTEQRVLGPTRYPLSPAEARNRQALLSKVHRFWIQGVLEHSLHGQVLLTLGLEERATALALPWNITVETAAQPAHPLDSGTRVFDVFEQLGEGRSLLILGEPGAGKTTTLLTLARDLLEVAQQDARQNASQSARQNINTARIPAIFNLSSWTGGAIDQWLIGELNSKYQIPKAIGKTWVNEQQLLPLLDGLDEVRADRQEICAAAINQFHRDYGPELVVCCRIKDYEALEARLGFQSALVVRSLTDQQIWQYLDTAETGLTGLKSLLERSVTQVPDGETPALLDLARSPLILNIMALTYQGVSARDIPALGAAFNTADSSDNAPQGDYIHQLFSAYIERMFERRGLNSEKPPYTKQQTLRWLHVLAKRLTETSQTVFLIERMQPSWLTSKLQRYVYVVLVWTSFLITATVIGFHVISPRSLPLALILGSAIFARIFGLYRISPAESLRWSWEKASRAILLGLTVGPFTGWILKVSFVHIFGNGLCIFQRACFQESSILGLAFGTVLGVTYGVIRGFSGERIATRTKPNQGIRQSGKNAILFAIVSSITPLFTARFLGNTSPAFWAASGLCFGLALGGGEACVKHGILRLILFCQGRIPWHYPHFLDYAAERIFLQKVGGGYIFIHRLLLEHFAAMPNLKGIEKTGQNGGMQPKR